MTDLNEVWRTWEIQQQFLYRFRQPKSFSDNLFQILPLQAQGYRPKYRGFLQQTTRQLFVKMFHLQQQLHVTVYLMKKSLQLSVQAIIQICRNVSYIKPPKTLIIYIIQQCEIIINRSKKRFSKKIEKASN